MSAAVGEGPPWKVVRVGVEASGEAAQSEKAAQAVEWALDRRGNLQFDLISLPPVEVGEAVENSIRRAIEAGVTVVVADSSTSESTMPGDAATALLIGHPVVTLEYLLARGPG